MKMPMQDTFRAHSLAHIINHSQIPLKQEKILAKSSLSALDINPLKTTKAANYKLNL